MKDVNKKLTTIIALFAAISVSAFAAPRSAPNVTTAQQETPCSKRADKIREMYLGKLFLESDLGPFNAFTQGVELQLQTPTTVSPADLDQGRLDVMIDEHGVVVAVHCA
jgi:hypothetical protein